jgi:hypothetical protein
VLDAEVGQVTDAARIQRYIGEVIKRSALRPAQQQFRRSLCVIFEVFFNRIDRAGGRPRSAGRGAPAAVAAVGPAPVGTQQAGYGLSL